MKRFLSLNSRYCDFFANISMYFVLQALLPFVLHITAPGALEGYELYRMREIYLNIVCGFSLSVVIYLVTRYEEIIGNS